MDIQTGIPTHALNTQINIAIIDSNGTAKI